MRSLASKKMSLVHSPRPPLSLFLLCIVSVFALLKILGTISPATFDSTNLRRTHMNYNSQKEAVTASSLTSLLQEYLQPCSKERDHYVPCYNVSANLLAGFKEGEEFDRHCDVSRQEEHQCLVRPPKDYKAPLRWPRGRDIIWSGNLNMTKDHFLSSGMTNKRMILLEENQIAFQSEDGLFFDNAQNYSKELAMKIGLESDSEFLQAGIHNVLDIGCGFGSFGAHLLSLNVMAICIAAYEVTDSQVQLALERGLPAMLGNFISRKLPFPSLSFGMVHCAQCGISWDQKDGKLLLEVDRILKPGAFFVLNSPTITTTPNGSSSGKKKRNIAVTIEEITEKFRWKLVSHHDMTSVWQKPKDPYSYMSWKRDSVSLCRDEHNTVSYYSPLDSCISGTTSKRWIPIQNRTTTSDPSLAELEIHGIPASEYREDKQAWKSALKNYWSLLTPLIFSDHPKRPGDEDPLPPFNMIRNVMDMNARYGNLNSAFVEDSKPVWVMNVVPVNAHNTLPFILDRGFAGAVHDWCEPFPTYPRTYDMIHANGLLSQISLERCSMIDVFLEMDRILRPEGWAILNDKPGLIEMAQRLASQVRWDARVIHLQNGSDQQLLVCQKPFTKK